jgi:hypothetical protein
VDLSRLFAVTVESGMKNILAFTGEYTGAGFGGQGAPVFDLDAVSLLTMLSERIEAAGDPAGRMIASTLEDPVKRLLLGCRHCGDCGIVHLAFLCPESQCPKHTRNGACSGSRNGRCEAHPERYCVWYRAWRRWAANGESHRLAEGCVPSRCWELDETASWLNFHLGRDHQGNGDAFARFCRNRTCRTEGLRG